MDETGHMTLPRRQGSEAGAAKNLAIGNFMGLTTSDMIRVQLLNVKSKMITVTHLEMNLAGRWKCYLQSDLLYHEHNILQEIQGKSQRHLCQNGESKCYHSIK